MSIIKKGTIVMYTGNDDTIPYRLKKGGLYIVRQDADTKKSDGYWYSIINEYGLMGLFRTNAFKIILEP